MKRQHFKSVEFDLGSPDLLTKSRFLLTGAHPPFARFYPLFAPFEGSIQRKKAQNQQKNTGFGPFYGTHETIRTSDPSLRRTQNTVAVINRNHRKALILLVIFKHRCLLFAINFYGFSSFEVRFVSILLAGVRQIGIS